MNETRINVDELKDKIHSLKVGDRILLSGTVYTARDAAHKRIVSLINENKELPFELSGSIIYYCGPTPNRPNTVIGSAGPTTSARMDPFTPLLLSKGLLGMIGKGQRSPEVVEAIKTCGSVYFCALGGAGALASKCISSCEVIAFSDLGCESVKKIELLNFPVIVGIDSKGNSIFK